MIANPKSRRWLSAYKKSGRGPPTSPTLRPRVLTPRDHFAHRGGGRHKIMHNSLAGCNRKLCVFFTLSSRVRDLTAGVCSPSVHSLPNERGNRFDAVKQDYYLIVLTTS